MIRHHRGHRARALTRRARSALARRVDWRCDAGFAGGAEVLPFGILIFVIGTLMVTNLWGVLDTKMATDAAAREGARLVAEADDLGGELGEGAAKASIATHGRDPQKLTYTVAAPKGWVTCAPVIVTASFPVNLINLPFLGISTGGSLTVSSTHSEIIDPYRSRDTDAGIVEC